MIRNTASQKVQLFAYDYSTGAPKTGDAAQLTAYVKKDSGALNALGDTSATEVSSTNAPGWYEFDVTQGETDAADLLFTGKSSTANVVVVGCRVTTVPPNFALLGVNSSGRVDLGLWLGVAPLALTSQQVQAVVPVTQKVDVETIKTQAVTAAAGVTFPSSIASPTNITAGTITTATNVTTVNGLAAGVITATSIAADAITAAKIADGAIDAATFAASAITATVLAADCITAAKIADGAIDANTFAAGAITATAIAADAIGSSELATSAVDEIVDAVWDELLSGHAISGSTGAGLTAAGAAGDPWSTTIPGAYGAGTAGKLLGTLGTDYSGGSLSTGIAGNVGGDVVGNVVGSVGGSVGGVNGDVSGDVTGKVLGGGAGTITGVGAWALDGTGAAVATATAVDALPTNAELATALGTADDAVLAAIAALSVPTANQNADALLDRANAIETAVTVRQALKAIAAALAGDVDGGGSLYRAVGNAGTTRLTVVDDGGGDRTVTPNL